MLFRSVATLKRGRDAGVFRADLDLDAAASLVLSTAWGLVSRIFTTKEELKAAARQLKSWMTPAR